MTWPRGIFVFAFLFCRPFDGNSMDQQLSATRTRHDGCFVMHHRHRSTRCLHAKPFSRGIDCWLRHHHNNVFPILYYPITPHQTSPWPRNLAKRRAPRPSRPSAVSVTTSKREVDTSKVPTFTDSSVASPDRPTGTRTPPPTKSLVLPGATILSLNTLRIPRNTLRYVLHYVV
jgi:hypothetical protein